MAASTKAAVMPMAFRPLLTLQSPAVLYWNRRLGLERAEILKQMEEAVAVDDNYTHAGDDQDESLGTCLTNAQHGI